MPKAAKRLFLIDGYSNIFRAFYAIRELSNSKGEPTNAVWGFLNMLRKLLREEQPELVGIALDVSSDTIRKDQYAEYKANRKPMPDDLRLQIPWIRRLIEAHRIPILELVKYEADDVLGTLSRAASAAGYEVVIVSADKDLMQLVDGAGLALPHRPREALRPRGGRGGLRRPAGEDRRLSGPGRRHLGQRARRAANRRQDGGGPAGRVRLPRRAPRARRRGQGQARREPAQPPRRRPPVARPGHHPHRPAGGVSPRRAAPRRARPGRPARALPRAGVPLVDRRARELGAPAAASRWRRRWRSRPPGRGAAGWRRWGRACFSPRSAIPPSVWRPAAPRARCCSPI